MAEGLTTLKSMVTAAQAYRMENDAWPGVNDWDNIVITMPSGKREAYPAIGGDAWVLDNGIWRFYLNGNGVIQANRGDAGSNYNLHFNPTSGRYFCQVYNGPKKNLYKKMCSSVCGSNPFTTHPDREHCEFK